MRFRKYKHLTKWRWMLLAPMVKGRAPEQLIANSPTRGYRTERECDEWIAVMKEGIQGATVETVEE
jgi:hypothetical protein